MQIQGHPASLHLRASKTSSAATNAAGLSEAVNPAQNRLDFALQPGRNPDKTAQGMMPTIPSGTAFAVPGVPLRSRDLPVARSTQNFAIRY